MRWTRWLLACCRFASGSDEASPVSAGTPTNAIGGDCASWTAYRYSDADGQIVEERPVTFSAEQLAAALDTFRGDIEQIPSMYSALKYQGKKLYEYARQGI